MADDQASSKEMSEGGEASDLHYDEDTTTMAPVMDELKTTIADDYDAEPIEDYVVKLVVNEQPEGVTSSNNLVDAAITDMHGNMLSSKTTSMIDAINDYSSTIYDEVSSTTAAIDGGKGQSGWTTQKIIIVGLIALCILAIVLALLFLVVGKKLGKNKNAASGTKSTTAKSAPKKDTSQGHGYQQVPSV